MINQVPAIYAQSIINMDVVFKNNTYFSLCKPGLIESVTDMDVHADVYADTISNNNK